MNIEKLSPELCVLVVSKARGDADMVCMHLNQATDVACEVEQVVTLAVASARLEEGGVDVIILSLDLPDGGGLSAFRSIREVAPDVPVVVLAGRSEREDAMRALREGAYAFMGRADLGERLVANIVLAAIERRRSGHDRRHAQTRCALALEGSGDGLWDWDLRTGSVLYSAQWSAILGLGARDVETGPERWLDRVHPEDLPVLKDMLQAHLAGGSRRFECEHRILGVAGDYQWVLARGLATSGIDGRPWRMAGTLTDISSRKEDERQLVHRTLHDELTGLSNRALFMDRLAVALSALRRRGGPDFGVLFLDLDRFKGINDLYGHSMGDRLLVEIARRLEGFLRPGDTLARLGGDEFAIMLNDVADAKEAVDVARRVRELLDLPFVIDGHVLEVTASTGVALSTTGYKTADEILHDADVAMYRAKSAGRGVCQVFDPEMHKSVLALLKMESELRLAVEHDELAVHFQPVVSLEQPRVVGFEGLVRWRHPEKGLLSPSRFLAVAEETGLIVPIDWWALAEACRQGRMWQRLHPSEEPLWIGMNISGKTLTQRDAVEKLTAIVEESGLEPQSLRFELTESVLSDHGEAAKMRLAELRGMGFRVTIDDFGGGCLSLDMLGRFRYDALKIHPTFVRGLGEESPGPVRTILDLADGMGIEVIAEGVETADQARHLRQLRCPEGQGFWFARPVAADAAERLLTSTPEWWIADIN